MAEVGCAGDPAALCASQFTYWQSPRLRPGTREFLSRVTVPVCVVSDVDRADLQAALAHHGLAFCAVVTSEDVGAYKPDRAMFTRALATLGLGADEVLHVGDSINADVRGAHAAGIRAAWINRRGQAVPEDAPVAYEISDLAGLCGHPMTTEYAVKCRASSGTSGAFAIWSKKDPVTVFGAWKSGSGHQEVGDIYPRGHTGGTGAVGGDVGPAHRDARTTRPQGPHVLPAAP